MSNDTTHFRVLLKPSHLPTGRTRHTRGGQQVPIPHELRIVQLSGPGFYLIHYDDVGNELTDTFHDSVQDAMQQAQWEFGVTEPEWTPGGEDSPNE